MGRCYGKVKVGKTGQAFWAMVDDAKMRSSLIMNAINRDALFSKISQLSDKRIAQIADFVELIRYQEDRALVRAAMAASMPSLAKVWDNPEDDVYNDL